MSGLTRAARCGGCLAGVRLAALTWVYLYRTFLISGASFLLLLICFACLILLLHFSSPTLRSALWLTLFSLTFASAQD